MEPEPRLSPDEGMPALDELLRAGLLHPTAVPRRFAFRHPLVRRAVYESTGGGWRLVAHARAAHRTLPNSRLHIIPGVGHHPPTDRPETVARLIDDFVATTAEDTPRAA